MTDTDCAALLEAREHNPFAVLGLHPDGAEWRLRVFRPGVKSLVTVIFIVSNALLPDGAWLAFVFGWIFLIAANLLSQLGIGYTLKRSLVALPFALIAITVLFSIPGEPIFTFHIHITE